jgi:hypothetical protein
MSHASASSPLPGLRTPVVLGKDPVQPAKISSLP